MLDVTTLIVEVDPALPQNGLGNQYVCQGEEELSWHAGQLGNAAGDVGF